MHQTFVSVSLFLWFSFFYFMSESFSLNTVVHAGTHRWKIIIILYQPIHSLSLVPSQLYSRSIPTSDIMIVISHPCDSSFSITVANWQGQRLTPSSFRIHKGILFQAAASAMSHCSWTHLKESATMFSDTHEWITSSNWPPREHRQFCSLERRPPDDMAKMVLWHRLGSDSNLFWFQLSFLFSLLIFSVYMNAIVDEAL